MKAEKISDLTIGRLSVYLRCLDDLYARGIETISSQKLASMLNLNSAQIRKDLAYFGEFGVRGIGYNIEDLRGHITNILGLSRQHRIGVIGAGNLGTALSNYEGFPPEKFVVAAVFDVDPARIGTSLANGVQVYDMAEFREVAARERIDIAAIAVPARAVKNVLTVLYEAGIRAVLNFAPVYLQPPPGVKMKNVDLLVSLESLSYSLTQPAPPERKPGAEEDVTEA